MSEFVDALRRVAAGGTAMEAEVVSQLLVARSRPLDDLTPRGREVLELVAEGRSDAAIAATLFITERSVEKRISNIFGKLRLPPSDSDHRRVLATCADY